MTLSELRASRDGRCVNSWKECNSFLYGAYRVIRNRLDMFLDERPIYKKGSGCVFYEGTSPQTPPRIVIEFSKGRTIFDDEDSARILAFIYKLTSWRGNLKFETNTGLSGQLRIQFEIRIKSYRSFGDIQPEMDLFAPEPFGGGASPPDPSLYYQWPKFPWVQPWFPPKLDPQWWLDLGAFTKCGNSTFRRSDICVPKITFSDLDPGEVEEDDYIPFEWLSSPEKSWQQIELPYARDEIAVPVVSKTAPLVSVWRSLLRKIVGTLVGFWRRIFS